MLNVYCLIKTWEVQPSELAISLAQCLDVAIGSLELYNCFDYLGYEADNIVFRFYPKNGHEITISICPDGQVHYFDNISNKVRESTSGTFNKLAEWCCDIKIADGYNYLGVA